MADKNVAAVVVGTPNKFHAEHAIAALRAGKHVFLEKPMAMNVAEADAIVAAHEASGKVLQMGMINRFRNSVKALKHFIDAGRCGGIYAGPDLVVPPPGHPRLRRVVHHQDRSPAAAP